MYMMNLLRLLRYRTSQDYIWSGPAGVEGGVSPGYVDCIPPRLPCLCACLSNALGLILSPPSPLSLDVLALGPPTGLETNEGYP